MDTNKHILLFDGECVLCNGYVDWLLKRDKKDMFRFVALQSDKGRELTVNHEIPEDLSSVALLHINGTIFTQSDVALEIARILGGWHWPLVAFKIVPRFIRDGLYNWIATNRYKWFGKRAECMVPTPDIRHKFIL